MASVIVFDSLGQPIAAADTGLASNPEGFSFTTGAAGGDLTDVKVSLQDATPADGGSVSVTLYSDGATPTTPPHPATLLATLGTIADNTIGTGPSVLDVPAGAGVTLAPNTRYWIQLSPLDNSRAAFDREADGSGTGSQNEFADDDHRGDGGGYSVYSNASGGAFLAEVTETTCFASGTLIRTTRGDVAVETLVVGDAVVTASGAHRPVAWLGHRSIDCRRQPHPHAIHPIRVAAHAFGEGRPSRDLFISPGHPVLAGADADSEGGYLVPIMCLINGTTIHRIAVDEVTYWHIELDAHDILIAEGLPAESYLDWGDRDFFAEGTDHTLANPDFVIPGLAGRCRPVALDGPVVEAERRRLDAIFAARLAAASAWPGVEACLVV